MQLSKIWTNINFRHLKTVNFSNSSYIRHCLKFEHFCSIFSHMFGQNCLKFRQKCLDFRHFLCNVWKLNKQKFEYQTSSDFRHLLHIISHLLYLFVTLVSYYNIHGTKLHIFNCFTLWEKSLQSYFRCNFETISSYGLELDSCS